MESQQITRKWFVLYTKSRSEFKANESLISQDIITYLPVRKSFRKWSDRKKEIVVPLFNGYIFINATEKERLLALKEKHIIRCISDAGRPSVVPDYQIENLQKMVSSQNDVEVISGLPIGKEIIIKSGLFQGIRGKILNIENKKHFAVSIELLNRTVVAHLSEDDLID